MVISDMVMNCFDWISGKLDFRYVPNSSVVNCIMVKKIPTGVYIF